MKAIVCVDQKWGIGKEGDLLFSLPQDMKFFRENTREKVVVMGGKTLRSFPNQKPLPKRVNIVLTRREDRDDCVICKDFESLLKTLKNYSLDDVFIIGGGSFYEMMLPYCAEALVTKVNADGNATVFFPNLDNREEWALVDESQTIIDNGYEIAFTKYINKNTMNF